MNEKQNELSTPELYNNIKYFIDKGFILVPGEIGNKFPIWTNEQIKKYEKDKNKLLNIWNKLLKGTL